jgi:hypothetical protein
MRAVLAVLELGVAQLELEFKDLLDLRIAIAGDTCSLFIRQICRCFRRLQVVYAKQNSVILQYGLKVFLIAKFILAFNFDRRFAVSDFTADIVDQLYRREEVKTLSTASAIAPKRPA